MQKSPSAFFGPKKNKFVIKGLVKIDVGDVGMDRECWQHLVLPAMRGGEEGLSLDES